jgi:glycosyltransferase involved in cell wall biosynthesis
VPEIIEDGITGVICDDPLEMVAAARIADKLFDRRRIRGLAAERWSARRMADDYLRLYRAAQLQQADEALDGGTAAGA